MSIGIGATLPSPTGLIFDYDMSNTQKSWKGQPTVNYVPNADTMAGWSNYSNGTPVQFTTEFGTIGYSMNNLGSWNGVARGVTIPSTGTYTFSAWIKWIGGSSNVTGGAVYISGWGGGDSATATNRTLPGQWQRISITLNCTTTSMTFYLICWGGTNNADNSSWQVTMPQIVAGSVATPFVLGTRSTTSAVVDLTGNTTITANSLTYNSDNTFSFNSANSATLSFPLATSFNKLTGTISMWVYPTSYNGGNGLFVNRTDSTPNAVDWLWVGPYSGTFYFRIGDGTACCSNDLTIGSYNSVVPINTWTHMTFTWLSGGTSAIYVNGVLNTSRSISTIPSTSPAANGSIGLGHSNADTYFNGKIATTQIYNRQLTAAEVFQLFSTQRGRFGI